MAINFNDIENKLWNAVDKLRANTHLRASEYLIPVLGLIFLKFADQKFTAVDQILQARRQSNIHQTLTSADYKAEGAIYLDEKARFSYLRSLSKDVSEALNQAMRLIERDNPESLAGALPTSSTAIDNDTLKALLVTFDTIPLDIEGDVFGKIYEYFLGKFALAEGQRGGEFFTPTSIVKLIVEIVEPYHGLIFDPACGSGGMFVQSAQFVQRHRLNTNEDISIYGQEKVTETVRLCKMNLAVHGLIGDIRDVNSYYADPHTSTNKFDFVMANPPFNVDSVSKERLINSQQRYPFNLPRVNNANYLWIQLFYSALKDSGRAGFVMPNSASDTPASQRDIRRKIIQDRVVDVIVAVGSNFFFTVTLPCTLWFFDKGKRQSKRKDKVLFIDARHIYRQIDRAHREFTPEQIEFLANIVRLYRGEPLQTSSNSTSLVQEHFPKGAYVNVPGLCKVATVDEIAAQNWSLNPGRYTNIIESVQPSIPRTIIFISYSCKDKKHLERLQVHLFLLKRNYNVDIWDDTKLLPGDVWREEIKKAIMRTKVAILLISADFLASKFIAEDELPPLLKAAQEDGTTILPVLLSPSMFKDTQLADFQAVNSKLLSAMKPHDKEDTWNKVALRVKDLMTS